MEIAASYLVNYTTYNLSIFGFLSIITLVVIFFLVFLSPPP